MFALLKGVMYSLSNQVKVSVIECFLSPRLTVVWLISSLSALTYLIIWNPICLYALRPYWSQHAMNSIAEAFFGLIRRTETKNKP